MSSSMDLTLRSKTNSTPELGKSLRYEAGNGRNRCNPNRSLASGNVSRGDFGRKPKVRSLGAPRNTKKENEDRRKKSIDACQLLNFDYGPPRGYHASFSKNENLRRSNHIPKYNVEHFLQANCQFAVRAKDDYESILENPDSLIDWENIEEVNFKTVGSSPSCPICLTEIPIAAKITKCGHIYCWSCILHYYALSDDETRSCPICQHPISKEDLKSVVITSLSSYHSGNELEMRLMIRNRVSVFPVPVTEDLVFDAKCVVPKDGSKGYFYSKMYTMEPSSILQKIVFRERRELTSSLLDFEGEPEICFVEEALKALDIRETSLRRSCLCEASELQGESTSLEPTGVLLDTGSRVKNVKQNKKDNFYFYQSVDGQMIYLHGLNAKMLECQFGDLEYAPRVIKGSILELESIIVTQELRNKFRYLRHLPLSITIQFAELDLRDSITFDKEVIEFFSHSMRERKKMRQQRALLEEIHELKIIETNKYDPYVIEASKVRIPSEFNVIPTSLDFPSTLGIESSLGTLYPAPLSYSNAIRRKSRGPKTSFTPSNDELEASSSSSIHPLPLLTFDIDSGLRVSKKCGKKKKSMILLSSAPRPQMN